LLDIGCGSGVVAIAAAKLGFYPVVALDLDEHAIEATLRNAAANDVAVDARWVDAIAAPLAPAEVCVANVTLDVVEGLLPRLAASRAITSGYLEGEQPDVYVWWPGDRREADGWAADLLEHA